MKCIPYAELLPYTSHRVVTVWIVYIILFAMQTKWLYREARRAGVVKHFLPKGFPPPSSSLTSTVHNLVTYIHQLIIYLSSESVVVKQLVPSLINSLSTPATYPKYILYTLFFILFALQTKWLYREARRAELLNTFVNGLTSLLLLTPSIVYTIPTLPSIVVFLSSSLANVVNSVFLKSIYNTTQNIIHDRYKQ